MITVVTMEEHEAVLKQLEEAKKQLQELENKSNKNKTRAELFMARVEQLLENEKVLEEEKSIAEGAVCDPIGECYFKGSEILDEIDEVSQEDLEDEVTMLIVDLTQSLANKIIESKNDPEESLMKMMRIKQCFPFNLKEASRSLIELDPVRGKQLEGIFKKLSKFEEYSWTPESK